MPADNVNRLINLFFMTNRSLHQHFQRTKFVKTFSLLQFIAMRAVGYEGTVSMKDIARILFITPASATSLVNSLVKMGALERIIDSSDRRVIRLRITASGRKTLNAAESVAKQELKRVFLQLNERDRSSMISVLDKLSGILSKHDTAVSLRRPSNGRKR